MEKYRVAQYDDLFFIDVYDESEEKWGRCDVFGRKYFRDGTTYETHYKTLEEAMERIKKFPMPVKPTFHYPK